MFLSQYILQISAEVTNVCNFVYLITSVSNLIRIAGGIYGFEAGEQSRCTYDGFEAGEQSLCTYGRFEAGEQSRCTYDRFVAGEQSRCTYI